jgi:glutathione S-transferase
MKLYWGPQTCAIGIHILLEEIGKPYDTERVDVSGGATRAAPFQSINAKGKVPTLVRDDGTVLTEFGAIATWLARTNPSKAFIPEDAETEALVVETMSYVEGTIHGQGYARILVPQQFEPQDFIHGRLGLGRERVRKQGREIVSKGFAILDPQVGRHAYAASESITIADFAMFYVERWAAKYDIALPINVQRHFDRMLARPAVHKVMALAGHQ